MDKYSVVRLLLDNGVNKEANDENGRTPLPVAIQALNSYSIAKLLFNRGADPESRDHESRTVLTKAVVSGDQVKIELLLKRGANEVQIRNQR